MSAAASSTTSAIVSVKPLPASKKKPPWWQLPPKLRGPAAEQLAVSFLQKHNFRILARNVRVEHDELDIVAVDTEVGELVIVEVKARTGFNDWDYFERHPQVALTAWKQAKLIRAVQRRFHSHILEKSVRFDIISILPNRVEHLTNVTLC